MTPTTTLRALAALTLTLATGCVVGGGQQSYEFHDLSGITIELGNGEVMVDGSHDACCATELTLDLGGVGSRTARGDVEVGDDGWLMVDARGLLGGGEIDARVPAGLPVEVLVERGEAQIELDAPADVYACVAAGEVYIEVPEGAYDLDLGGGAGQVSTEGVVHDPDAPHRIGACVGAGEVSVVGDW